MSKEFDYVAFAREFEATNGRPPTADELDEAKWSHYGIKWHTPEESQAELERIKATYKPSFGDRFKDGLSFLGHGFFKALLFLIKSPIYLTLLFFNYIKSAVAVMIMFFVTKMAVFVIISAFMEHFNISNLSQASGLLGFIGKFVMTNDLQPNFWAYPAVDIIVIQFFIILFALILTFSKVDETH